ncbi:unnamed protein product [Microthlaspi erraticum]|uniref:Uncharacterized protein n=1 Tax=Microthlaspi erraticum TaxID=1685480 RepID=A0A6D2JJM7_9BRAS|nr:unnamed protein product [Microthlaspi erraticum]
MVNSKENTPTGSPSRSEGHLSDDLPPPTIDKSLPTEDRDKSVPPRSQSTSPRRSPSPRKGESDRGIRSSPFLSLILQVHRSEVVNGYRTQGPDCTLQTMRLRSS